MSLSTRLLEAWALASAGEVEGWSGEGKGGDWEGVVQALHAISFLLKGPIRFENVH